MVVPRYDRVAAEVAELCRRAEATGADSLWAVDHLFWPHPMAEAFTTLAVAAAATTSAHAGDLRPPAAAAPSARRGQAGHRAPAPLRRPLRPGRGRRHPRGRVRPRRRRLPPAGPPDGRGHRRAPPGLGQHPTTGRSDYVQEPASPPVPLWMGGSSPAARRRAAAVGDGWVPLFLTADEYGPRWPTLRRETAEAGRDPDAVRSRPSSSSPAWATTTAPIERGAALALRPVPAPAQGVPAPPGRRVRPRRAPPRSSRYADAGAAPHRRHGGRLTRPSSTSGRCGAAFAGDAGARTWRGGPGMSVTDVAVLGTGMTDMSRRDLTPEHDGPTRSCTRPWPTPGVDPAELGAGRRRATPLGGRLNDQGCIRGQSWLRKAGLGDVAIVNVDNSCAGGQLGPAPGHPGRRAPRTGPSSSLGRREDVDRRPRRHAGRRSRTGCPRTTGPTCTPGRRRDDNPAGSILMGLNDGWAEQFMDERGATVEQIAAAAVKARRHGARNPLAQCQQAVTHRGGARGAPGGGRADPADVQLLHRRGGGRRARRAGRAAAGRSPVSSARWPARDAATSTTTTAWPRPPRRPTRPSASARRTSTSSSCTTPPSAEELYALESLGIFGPGEAGPGHRWPAHTAIGGARHHGQPERRPGRPGPSPRRDRDRPGRRARDPVPRPGRAPARSRAPGSGWPSTPAAWSTATPAMSACTPSRRRVNRVATGITVTRLRHRRPRQGPDQRRPGGHARHERRVDHRADRHQGTPHRRHDLGARRRGRPAGARAGRARPRPTSTSRARHDHARRASSPAPPRPSKSCSGCARAARSTSTPACSGFVYGLVVSAGLVATGAGPRSCSSAPTP